MALRACLSSSPALSLHCVRTDGRSGSSSSRTAIFIATTRPHPSPSSRAVAAYGAAAPFAPPFSSKTVRRRQQWSHLRILRVARTFHQSPPATSATARASVEQPSAAAGNTSTDGRNHHSDTSLKSIAPFPSSSPSPKSPSSIARFALPALLLAATALLLPTCLTLLSPLPALASGASSATAAYASAGAATSIAHSSLGQRVAGLLRASHWPDAAIVAFIAALPVVELRGAIPVAYWMGMQPIKASALAVAGNMLPVPLLLSLLGPASSLAKTSPTANALLNRILERTRQKAGPIAEFRWLGLALFVAVPLPGTGAWSGAIGAHVLGMPFAEALTANLAGVVMAAVLVNMLVTLPLQQALGLAVLLLLFSSVCWTMLRWLRQQM